MFSGKLTNGSTGNYSAQIDRLKEALRTADAVLIGAGAGLSASAGFVYSGARFRAHFADFEDQYGFRDMYSGGFYPFPSPNAFWAYWSRYIRLNRYTDAPKPVYGALRALVADKDYFALTTNVDHCFQKAGFDKQRLFYTQGDYGLFQCSAPCRQETWDNEQAVLEMVRRQENMLIPSDLIPRCPHCGRPAAMNLRADENFAEDAGWHTARARYEAFVATRHAGRVLCLELGVGWNTPGIIKYPFWDIAAQNKDAVYACVNRGDACCPEEIASRAILINADIGQALNDIAKA